MQNLEKFIVHYIKCQRLVRYKKGSTQSYAEAITTGIFWTTTKIRLDTDEPNGC